MMKDELMRELVKNGWDLEEVLKFLDEMLDEGTLDADDLIGTLRRAFLFPPKLSIATALFWLGYRHGRAAHG